MNKLLLVLFITLVIVTVSIQYETAEEDEEAHIRLKRQFNCWEYCRGPWFWGGRRGGGRRRP
uniref:Uncharacterized protein n=1 Tax=Meloidogyne enterolobii TaxID=390850 RepID=A0A6V7V021_MELEN|nr:unnamed protein product [Meloidogyne enterolobii]